MSHFSVLAIGFEDEDALDRAMAPYDERHEVAPYVSMTKEEILEKGRQSYKERCEIIKAYEESPFEAVKKYGSRAQKIYENRRKRQYPNFKDPEKYYEWYVEDRIVDPDGNLISMYNPDSKWDYYDVEETMTIGDLKKEMKEYFENFDPSPYEMIWDKIVNGIEPEAKGIDLFFLLYGQPDKENLLRMYGSKAAFVDHYKNSYHASYAVLANYGWVEPGTVGWWGMSSATFDAEKEFRETYFSKFIEPYDDDTPVYRIDCHI